MIAATISEAIPSAWSKPVSEDDGAGDRGEDEGGQVGEDVLEGALDVQRLAVGLREDADRDQVDDDPEQGDDEHDAALHPGRVDQPADALVDDQQAEHEQRRAVELGAEDLRRAASRRSSAPRRGARRAGSRPARAPARRRR